MLIFFINYNVSIHGVDSIIATVIATNKEHCLLVLGNYLSDYDYSAYANDDEEWQKDKDIFIEAIDTAQSFELANNQEESKVIYYEGP